jgi:ribosome production factor 2
MATTHRGKKFLESREPHIEEDRKCSLFIKGRKSSLVLGQVWDALARFRYREIVKYSHKNDTLPFESVEEIEHFCKKSDCSLFVFFSDSKKRRNNVIFGRLFDSHVLEMYEVGILDFVADLPSGDIEHAAVPALLFEGDRWDTDFSNFRSVLIDFFVGDLKGTANLQQIQHALAFTIVEGEQTQILVRHYQVDASGSEPNLLPVSPSFAMVQRRTMHPDPDVFASAMVKPVVNKKKKNIVKDDLGRELGRVFVKKQNVAGLRLKKFSGLKKEKMKLPPEPADDVQ